MDRPAEAYACLRMMFNELPRAIGGVCEGMLLVKGGESQEGPHTLSVPVYYVVYYLRKAAVGRTF